MKVERRRKNFPSFKQGKHNFYNESNEDETLPAGQLVIFFFPPSFPHTNPPARRLIFPPHFYSISLDHQQTKKNLLLLHTTTHKSRLSSKGQRAGHSYVSKAIYA